VGGGGWGGYFRLAFLPFCLASHEAYSSKVENILDIHTGYYIHAIYAAYYILLLGTRLTGGRQTIYYYIYTAYNI
jgi:hypothetical protein